MKKMFLMLIMAALSLQISAQSFSYQAVVRDAKGYASVALGKQTKAVNEASTVIGKYNLDSIALFVVGMGNDKNSRKDAFVIKQDGSAQFVGVVKATQHASSSDLRFKTQINDLDNALQTVLKLRGVSYYWKSQNEIDALTNGKFSFNSQEKQIGVIAQEVEEICPELVLTDNDGFKSVSYDKFTPILIEAIKEQQDIIDALKTESNELHATVNNLQQELENMKAQMQQLMESMKK